MKKKSIAARLGVAAMALTLITTSLSSGTLAKYTETFAGTTTMTVARWNVGATVTMGSGASATTLTSTPVALGTLYDTATNKKGVSNGKVAPGMTGGFVIDLTTAKQNVPTEVDTEYAVYIDGNSSDFPTNFKMYEGSNEANNIFDKSKTKVPGLGYLLKTDTIAAGQPDSTKNAVKVNVNWKWPFEETSATNAADVALGKDPGLGATFTVRVVFTQKEPTVSTGS